MSGEAVGCVRRDSVWGSPSNNALHSRPTLQVRRPNVPMILGSRWPPSLLGVWDQRDGGRRVAEPERPDEPLQPKREESLSGVPSIHV